MHHSPVLLKALWSLVIDHIWGSLAIAIIELTPQELANYNLVLPLLPKTGSPSCILCFAPLPSLVVPSRRMLVISSHFLLPLSSESPWPTQLQSPASHMILSATPGMIPDCSVRGDLWASLGQNQTKSNSASYYMCQYIPTESDSCLAHGYSLFTTMTIWSLSSAHQNSHSTLGSK